MSKATEKTCQWHRARGLRIGRVEQDIRAPGMQHAMKRDLFNAFDYIALHPEAVIGIQVGDASNHSHHREKILKDVGIRQAVREWLESGHGHTRAEIWSWGFYAQRNPDSSFKKNKDGTRKKKKWQVRIENITLEMIREEEENEKHTQEG